MSHTATVTLWGTKIGYLYLDDDKKYASFEYDRDFIQSGVELSPIMMPLSNRIYEFPELSNSAFKGVPGLLADSLPDKFGNAVIDQWLATEGRTSDSFNVVERLCYTGKRGMGALEYEPAVDLNGDRQDKINIAKLVDFASAILEEKKQIHLSVDDDMSYHQLIKLGTSAGGARAKAIIAYHEKTGDICSGQIDTKKGYDYWLIKFDGISKNGDYNLEDSPEYTMIEYAYYKMALKAGILMNECKLLKENDRKHFMTKRFDRVGGKKIHMQSLGALMHIDYNEPGQCSYELAAITAKKIGLPANQIEQLYRRMVFNVLAVNQDDHVKNISFLMDRNGIWSLSPAYDMTFACDSKNKWLQAHQMTINGRRSNITIQDIITCGQNMDLKKSKCQKIIEEVKSVVCEWPEIAQSVKIRENTIDLIQKELERNSKSK